MIASTANYRQEHSKWDSEKHRMIQNYWDRRSVQLAKVVCSALAAPVVRRARLSQRKLSQRRRCPVCRTTEVARAQPFPAFADSTSPTSYSIGNKGESAVFRCLVGTSGTIF